ncbi:transposase [Corallincola platygyrae]
MQIETIGFSLNHLQMVMTLQPKYSVSDVIGRLKSRSSSRMRTTFKWLS